MRRYFAEHFNMERTKGGWLAVGAVAVEPLSTVNSLVTGKLTGKFAESGLI
jgi:hypothetical protein